MKSEETIIKEQVARYFFEEVPNNDWSVAYDTFMLLTTLKKSTEEFYKVDLENFSDEAIKHKMQKMYSAICGVLYEIITNKKETNGPDRTK